MSGPWAIPGRQMAGVHSGQRLCRTGCPVGVRVIRESRSGRGGHEESSDSRGAKEQREESIVGS